MKFNLYNLKKDIFAALILTFFFSISLLSISRISFLGYEQSPKALTFDELSHISSGYYYLTQGRMFLNPEHPPLAKDVAALPLLFMDVKSPEIVDNKSFPENYDQFLKQWELENQQWEWGRAMIFHPKNNPEEIIFWSRFSSITFNTILLGILYLFLRKTFSTQIALISLFLISTSATFIAHASLSNTDISNSLFLALSIISFCNFYKKFLFNEKFGEEFLILILFVSLSCLTKFNSLILFPFFFSIGLVPLFLKNKKLIKYFLLYFFLLCLSCGVLITLFYIPHSINMSAQDMIRSWETYYVIKSKGLPEPLTKIMYFFMQTDTLTRAAFTYAEGLVLVFWRLKNHKQEVYFLGNFYINQSAGPLYTPVLFLTKISSIFFFLIIPVVFFSIKKVFSKQKIYSLLNKDNLHILVFSSFALLYFITSIFTKLQIGIRHSLPFILCVFILTAIGISKFWNKEIFKTFKMKTVFFLSSIFLLLSLLAAFPNYISYYNIFPKVFGREGYEIANDSNYDWGQDIVELSEWAKENEIPMIYCNTLSSSNLNYYFNGKAKPFDIRYDPIPASGSYIAISRHFYQNNIADKSLPPIKKYDNLNKREVVRIGKTIIVYQIL